jgi:hypothetical protein
MEVSERAASLNFPVVVMVVGSVSGFRQNQETAVSIVSVRARFR